TTAAGVLLTAERAADLRAARPDVDVGDAAIGARRSEEPLRLTDVGGEDRRGETLRHVVLDRNGLVEIAVLEHVENRRKRLLADDVRLCGHPHDRRLRVPGVWPAIGMRTPTARDDLAPRANRAIERHLHASERLAGDQRPDERPRLPR